MNGNITTAPLGGNRNIKTKPLFQYDYGQVLKIVGVTLPAAYEVHFSNQLHGVATTQIGNADGVIIPDIYLTTGEPVYAWIYLHTGNSDGETEYTITIPVVRRASISDAEPTPVQQDVITQAIAALNTAVEQTAQDAQDATEAKQDAEEAAGNAYESAVAAAQSAANANTSAGQAQTAQAASELAQQKAEEAQTGAQTAKWAAESAQTAAEAAQAGAVAARTGAETAQAWAVAARSGAEAAQHAAEAARDEITGLSATATTLPAGSDATASYSNGLLTIGVPKGEKGDTGDTPDFTIGTVQTLPAGSSATASITGTDEQPVLNLGIPKGDQGDGTPAGGLKGQVLAKASDADHDTEWIYTAPVIKNTASGAIASFSDGAEMPVDEVTVQINPVQDLHGYDSPWPAGGGKNLVNIPDTTLAADGSTGDISCVIPAGTYTFAVTTSTSVAWICRVRDADGNNIVTPASSASLQGRQSVTFTISQQASFVNVYFNAATKATEFQIESGSTATTYAPYSNICPISGHTGLTVTRTGKNIINPSELVYSAGGNNVWYGTQLPPDTDFVFSTDSTIVGLYVEYSDADEMPSISGTGWASITYKYNTTSLGFNSGSHKWYRLMTYEINGVIRDRLYQLEIGSIATAYEPYQGETYEVEFPSEAGTVYGGSLTIAEDGSGVLTVTKESLVFDSSAWSFSSNFFYKANTVEVGRNVSGYYIAENGIKMYLNSNNGQARIYLADNDFLTSESDVGLMLNGYKLLYDLATPITYTLTATQITTLLGQNNLWHDANGEIAVVYKANTKLYVDGKITELIAQIVNS